MAKNGVNELDCSWITERPIAHRGLHDRSIGLVENSISACMQAARLGYPIECDLRAAGDGTPMVFHDSMLDRLTANAGPLLNHSSSELENIELKRGRGDTIPTFTNLLSHLSGKVPLIVELKSTPGESEDYVANILDNVDGYDGKLAFMSFDHHLLERLRQLNCAHPVGLTAEGGDSAYGQHIGITRRLDLDFVSYSLGGLNCSFVREIREANKPLISWTVCNVAQQEKSFGARAQITFEGFLPSVTDRPG